MRITLITVGKIKEKYFTDAIAEYQKRLSRYCKLEILEVADEKTPDGASAAIEEQIKEKEAERVRKVLKDSAYTIALAIVWKWRMKRHRTVQVRPSKNRSKKKKQSVSGKC